MAEAHVYVISAGDSAVKVGIAMRPKERLRALQTAHYQRLSLFDSIAADVQGRSGRIQRGP